MPFSAVIYFNKVISNTSNTINQLFIGGRLGC